MVVISAFLPAVWSLTPGKTCPAGETNRSTPQEIMPQFGPGTLLPLLDARDTHLAHTHGCSGLNLHGVLTLADLREAPRPDLGDHPIRALPDLPYFFWGKENSSTKSSHDHTFRLFCGGLLISFPRSSGGRQCPHSATARCSPVSPSGRGE